MATERRSLWWEDTRCVPGFNIKSVKAKEVQHLESIMNHWVIFRTKTALARIIEFFLIEFFVKCIGG